MRVARDKKRVLWALILFAEKGWAIPALQWDPPPLGAQWWRRKATALPPVSCNTVQPGALVYYMHGTYGRLNNALSETAHMLDIAAKAVPQAAAVKPAAWKMLMGANFDFFGATRGWVCVFETLEEAQRLGLRPRALDPRKMLYSRPTVWTRYFKARFYAQVLLRPAPHIRALVEEFERVHLGMANYTGIHLRGYEGKCARMTKRKNFLVSYEPRKLDTGEDATEQDVCRMADGYVRGFLDEFDLAARSPIVLAHDGELPARVEALRQSFNVTVFDKFPRLLKYSKRDDGAVVDMLLMLRSHAFMGNPVSTFALNVMRVRELLIRDPLQNYHPPSLRALGGLPPEGRRD